MGSRGSKHVSVKGSNENAESLVRSIQLCSDKTAMMLNITALVAYPMHAILVYVSTRRRQWLISNRRKLVGFIQECRTQKQLEKDGNAEDEELSEYGPISSMTVMWESGVLVTTDVE